MAGGAIEVAGDIAAAGGALSGLMLVYMGALSSGFSTFEPMEKPAVRPSYQRRTWFAFAGLVLFLAAVTLALFGKLFDLPCVILGALALLLLGMGWLVATAVFTAMEIN